MENLKETKIEIVPSEDVGYVCAMLVTNERINGTLRMTEDDVRALIHVLEYYLEL